MRFATFDPPTQHRLTLASRGVVLTSLAYAAASLLTSSDKVRNHEAVWHGVTAASHLLLPLGCALFPMLFALALLRVVQADHCHGSRRRLVLCSFILAGGCLAFYGAVLLGA